ncbi:MAG: hypothetical protein ABIO94_10050 [Opitutaceae bacterium]
MSFEEFHASVARDSAPPATAGLALRALWYDARGDWERAHGDAQEDKSRDGSWVHAYLHRKEGDRLNADYWYQRAGKAAPRNSVSLDDEWQQIARELLQASRSA